MLETLSANLDVIYSGLEQFYDWFSRQPVNAEKEYSLQLTDYLRRLEEFEDSLWRQLRRRFNQVNTQASENRHFIELLRAINSRRTHLIVRINNLLQAQTSPALAVAQTRALAKPALAPASGGTGKGFKELLTKFIISDDLDSLDALSEIFFRYRSELVRLLGNDSNIGEKTRSHLLKRFWKFAHIVLIEDHYYLERPVPDEQPGSVFQSLSRTANTHNGFLRIQQLIQQPKEQVLAFLQQLPPTYDTQATTNHSRVIYSCMLVAYPDKDVRRYVAGTMSLSDRWSVVIHEKVPGPSLSIVAHNLVDSEVEDDVKVFFDCI
jgi:hypothetical protein